jgi:hypothetical protein
MEILDTKHSFKALAVKFERTEKAIRIKRYFLQHPEMHGQYIGGVLQVPVIYATSACFEKPKTRKTSKTFISEADLQAQMEAGEES